MIAWQHILCAITFTAGIIDIVAVYKYYVPQIFNRSEPAVVSSITLNQPSLDSVSSPPPTPTYDTLQPSPEIEHKQPQPLKVPDQLEERDPNANSHAIDDSVPELVVPDSDDLVLDLDQTSKQSNPNENKVAISEAQENPAKPLSSDETAEFANDSEQVENNHEIGQDADTSSGEMPALVFLFRKNVAELNWRDESKLRRHVRSLRENDRIEVRLIGFADPRGSSRYNYYLGLKRARNVARFLARRGVPHSRIHIVSSGEDDETSLAVPTNNQDMNRRRRVEVYFTKKDESTDE